MKKLKENLYYIQNHLKENNSFVIIQDDFCYIVDPSWNNEIIINFINERHLKLKGIILTHLHSDHVGYTTKILDQLNCSDVYVSIGGKEIVATTCNRIFINDYDFKNHHIHYVNDLDQLDDIKVKFLLTPGHSSCSMCVIYKNIIMTGDHIFLDEIGRTDLGFSSLEEMKESIKKFKTYVLEHETKEIYPGHSDLGFIKDVLIKNKYLRD
ncbi:MAG: MBL fold metallo-hydrolase [Mycoplasmoidaceae bacterium]